MPNKNQFRIEYNPYKQTIQYAWREKTHSEWSALADDSPLCDKKYCFAVLQNILDDVIKVVGDKYSFDQLEIVFVGTDDDFVDLDDSIGRYNDGAPINKQLIAIKEAGERYKNAEEILPEIGTTFDSLQREFATSTNSEVGSILAKYKDTMRETIPVCVMGTYSAGKSAFINALIGEEILPSASDPLTARVFKVTPSDDYRIECDYDDNHLVISFPEGQIKCSPRNTPNNAVAELLKRLYQCESSNCTQGMSQAIEILNSDDSKCMEMIEVHVPFTKSGLPLDTLCFEFYDTPGSDSVTQKEHIEVLKRALAGRTNGLPIIVVTPESLDKTSTEEILKTIDGIQAFDQNNAIIIINRADGEIVEDLKKTISKKHTVITRWKTNRIMCLSAAMAIGSKKTGREWNDKKCRVVFKDKKGHFSDPDDDDYTSLPMCNQLPKERYASMLKAVAEAEENYRLSGDEKSMRRLIAQNSGICGVESEIAFYGERMASYNKCRNAIKYLGDAIRITQGNIETAKIETEKKQGEAESEFDRCYKQIMESISTLTTNTTTNFNHNVAEKINKGIMSAINYERIKSEVQETAEKHRKDRSVDELNKELKTAYENYGANIHGECSAIAKKVSSEIEQAYKQKCISIISGSDQITQEEKDFLVSWIIEFPSVEIASDTFDLHKEGLVIDRKFLGFLWKIGEKVDSEKCSKAFVDDLKEWQATIISNIVEPIVQAFKPWCKRFKGALETKAKEFNPKLRELDQQIALLQRQIEEMTNQLAGLNQANEKINGLMERQTVGGEGNG